MTHTLSYPKEKIRIVLFEGIHDNARRIFLDHGYANVECLASTPPRDELKSILKGATMVGIRSRTHLDAEALEAAGRLLAIGCFCIGTNQVDLHAAALKGIPVFNAPHSNTRSVAELVIGYTILLLRGSLEKSTLMHEGIWRKSAKGSHEIRGKTLGIVGYGHIGSQVSVLAEAMGMRVIFHDIAPTLPLGNAQPANGLDDLLERADVVTLHVPGGPGTAGLLDRDRIYRMKEGAALINTSRGTVVDLDAVAERLRAGGLSGAAVDVFPTEPGGNDIPFASPLRGIRNAILTPHVAGSTLEAQSKIGIEVSSKLVRYSDEGSTVGSVNFPELNLVPHADAHRILHTHRNVPGILRQINEIVAEEGLNVVGQHLQTTRDLGYVALDLEKSASDRLLEALRAIEGTIHARILY